MTVEITWHENTEGKIRLKWCRRVEAGALLVDEKHQTTTTDDENEASILTYR